MAEKPWNGPYMKVEDILAYLVVLLMVGWIYDILPSSVTTGPVWDILWRSVAVLALVVVPGIGGIVALWKFIQLSKRAS